MRFYNFKIVCKLFFADFYRIFVIFSTRFPKNFLEFSWKNCKKITKNHLYLYYSVRNCYFMNTSFTAKLQQIQQKNNSLLCVGLDPNFEKLPEIFQKDLENGVVDFCCKIVDATADLVCAYKPQIAYFSAIGAETALEKIIAYIHQKYSGKIPVILDAKRGDIGSTAEQYAKEAFERYQADAVTVNPYMGTDSLESWFKYTNKGVFLLCRTSNVGGSDLQFLDIKNDNGEQQKIYQKVAELAASKWNPNEQTGLVVGATFPQELKIVRKIVGDEMPLLVPGIGAQGGDILQTVQSGQNSKNLGLILNSSRAILFADNTTNNFDKVARSVAEKTLQEIRLAQK